MMSQPIYSLWGITTNVVILTLNQNPQFPNYNLCWSGVTIYLNPLRTVRHTIAYNICICGHRRDVKKVKTEGKKKFYGRKMDKANGKRFNIQLNAWKSSHQQWRVCLALLLLSFWFMKICYELMLLEPLLFAGQLTFCSFLSSVANRKVFFIISFLFVLVW